MPFVIVGVSHRFKIVENLIVLLSQLEIVTVVSSDARLFVDMRPWPFVKVKLDVEDFALK